MKLQLAVRNLSLIHFRNFAVLELLSDSNSDSHLGVCVISHSCNFFVGISMLKETSLIPLNNLGNNNFLDQDRSQFD